MINYTSQHQIKLELFKHPFETELDKENRWVKLSALIPWDRLASIYSRKLQAYTGRKSVNVRTVIAALIVKHKLRLDDRGTIEMIKENIYLQYFCGLEGFTTKAVFDPSLFVDIRKRLGGKEFEDFNRLIIEESEKLKPHQARIIKNGKTSGKTSDRSGDSLQGNKAEEVSDMAEKANNRGTLKVDATVADQEIKYPNDVSLLNESRRQLERMIGILYEAAIDGQRPRLYPRKARKEYLNFAKKKRKSKKEIRRGIKAQLQYVRRDLKIIDKMLSCAKRLHELKEDDRIMLEVIRKIYQQQKWMYDNKTHSIDHRIVSLYQWWVRPIVRGKDKNRVEFGSKINVSEVGGFCRIDHFSWEAFNEGTLLKEQVENFKMIYGCYPKYLLADRIYLNRENRKYLMEKGIKITGKPLGRPTVKGKQTAAERYRKKKKSAERNHIEGKFGQGKRGYHLNNIKARLPETSESWINAIIMVMNLTKLLMVAEKYGKIFFQFLFHEIFAVKKRKISQLGSFIQLVTGNLIFW
jgi:hypothetical protein